MKKLFNHLSDTELLTAIIIGNLFVIILIFSIIRVLLRHN